MMKMSNIRHARNVAWFLTQFVIWFIFSHSIVYGQDMTRSQVGYPDIWNRTFEGDYIIFDMFFSDRDVWGEEPVVILKNLKAERYKAVAFFSGKNLDIYAERLNAACRKNLFNRYFYSNNKKEMSRIYLAPQEYKTPQEGCGYKEEMSDGNRLAWQKESLLQNGRLKSILLPPTIKDSIRDKWNQGEADSNYFDFLKDFQRVYTTIGESESNCEPMNVHLVRFDKDKNVVWSKTLVMFFPLHEQAPDQYNDLCVSKKTRIKVAGGPLLILSDQSILISVESEVLRLRGIDGESPPEHSNVYIFDTEEVISAKLDFMKAAAIKQKTCTSSGDDVRGLGNCKLYRVNADDLEKLQVDLFNYIVEKPKK